MFGYYLDLALRSLKRNKVLTALMVVTLAVGIGACITTLTVLRLLSGDPIPQKSARLFSPQLDPFGSTLTAGAPKRPQTLMSYRDAMALLHAHKAQRQTVTAGTAIKVAPAGARRHPFFSDGVMTTQDFFRMFDVPFKYGSSWSAADETSSARKVVIAGFLNQKLFGGGNNVGRSIRIENHEYRIVGVLEHWAPQPHFYVMGSRGVYGDGDGVFVPLSTALDDAMHPGSLNCYAKGDYSQLKTAPCMWLIPWVQLAHPSQAESYKRFFSNYVAGQVQAGRLHRHDVALPDLMQYLHKMKVVPDDARLQAQLALGFLLICVVNTVGLLLAKCLRRSREIGVRRALGATRWAIFAQFLTEAGVIGIAGGVLGLILALLGLWSVRQQPADYAKLAHLDPGMFAFTFGVALVASLIAGLLPAWRACVIAPAPQLKST